MSIRIAYADARVDLGFPGGRLARDQLVLAGHPVVVLLRANAPDGVEGQSEPLLCVRIW